MKKKIGMLLVSLLTLNFNYVYALDRDSIVGRAKGAAVVLSIVLILWTVLAYFLLKSEPKVTKVNMADRYRELTLDKIKKYGIQYQEFKKNIYQLFKNINIAFSDNDYNKLKLYLTEDLYRYYKDEMKKLNNKGYKNMIGGFELLKFKIFDINNSYDTLRIDVYLNIIMYDYIVDVNTNEVINDNSTDKKEFEFELTLVRENDGRFVLCKKNCVNKMDLVGRKSI